MPSVRLSTYDQRTQTPEGGVESGVVLSNDTGRALEGAGAAGMGAAEEFQQVNNTVAAKRADTAYAEKVNSLLYDPESGYLTTKRGEDALNELPKVQDALKKARSEVAGTLTNPVQQRMFNMAADGRDLAWSGDLKSYAGSQFRAYQDTVSDDRIAQNTQLFIGSGDPESQSAKLAMAQISAETLAKANRAGLHGEDAAWQQAQARSRAYGAMVEAGLDKTLDGPFRAGDILEKYGDKILPSDRAVLQAKVNQAQTASAAVPIALAAVAGALPKDAPQVSGKPLDLKNPAAALKGVLGSDVTVTSTLRTPSQNAAVKGSPTSSHLDGQAVDFVPKGMSTADAVKKLAASGVAFDQLIDEGDHVHIGFGEKMRGQVLTKQGDAYVPSTQSVQRAANGAQAAFAAHAQAGKGGPVTLEDARASAASYAETHFPNNPHMAAMIDTQVVTEWRRQNTELRERQRDAWQTVQTVVQGNGDLKDIPADAWNDLTPQQQVAARKLLENGGYAHQSDPATLGGLFDLAAKDPKAFASADIIKLAPKLSKGDVDSLLHLQLSARQGDGGWKPASEGITQVDRAATLTMPPAIAKDHAKSQAFKGALFSAATAAQATKGKPLTDDEVVALGHNLSVEQVNGHGLFGDKTKPLYQWTYDDLHDGDRASHDRVVSFLMKQNGGKAPSKQQVLDTYLSLKATGRL